MQQKHKERQKIERIGETPSLTKTREEAARGRTTLGIRPKTLQAQVSEKPTPQQGQRRASCEKETMLAPSLEFHPCDLLGPDGQTRPGWELWVGNMMFGRADAKETLLAYHTRLHDPLPSGHWKDRTWQSAKKRPTRPRSHEEKNSQFDDDNAEIEPKVESSWKE